MKKNIILSIALSVMVFSVNATMNNPVPADVLKFIPNKNITSLDAETVKNFSESIKKSFDMNKTENIIPNMEAFKALIIDKIKNINADVIAQNLKNIKAMLSNLVKMKNILNQEMKHKIIKAALEAFRSFLEKADPKVVTQIINMVATEVKKLRVEQIKSFVKAHINDDLIDQVIMISKEMLEKFDFSKLIKQDMQLIKTLFIEMISRADKEMIIKIVELIKPMLPKLIEHSNVILQNKVLRNAAIGFAKKLAVKLPGILIKHPDLLLNPNVQSAISTAIQESGTLLQKLK